MDVATVRYDKDGDDHYDVISAFIKSMREAPIRRHHALSGPHAARGGRPALHRTTHHDRRIRGSRHGRPAGPASHRSRGAGSGHDRHARSAHHSAEAALAVATAPKSNASYNAINAALADVDAGLIGQVPLHLRNAPTALMKSWGNHEGYRYAHDWPGAVAPQQYMPDELQGREYYHPNDRGYEHEVKPRLERIRKILHEEDDNGDGRSGQRNA